MIIWFEKYKVIKILSESESSSIYLIEHIKLKIYRVAKRISKSNKLYEQLLGEAHILKDLKHSCIPVIYDIEEDYQYSYIIEEYIEGESLKLFRLNQGQISQEVIVRFGIQICRLIEYLHTDRKYPILYLDLKPDNIIVSEGILKLIDFGTAVYSCDTKNRKYILGTKGYAPPEQYTSKSLDERSDIYSIGMLLYFLVTGVTFNNTGNIKNIDRYPNCSRQLGNIINKSLKYNPSQRFSEVKQLNNKLSAIIKNNTYGTQLEKSLTISLAGSQNRIGTTHIGFMLIVYLQLQGYKCLYKELNPSNTIRLIADRHEIVQNQGIYRIHKYNMMSKHDENNVYEVDKIDKFNIIINDFGLLTEENIEQYLQSDLHIVIMGAKEWELTYSENTLLRLIDCNNIHYLFNFIDNKIFRKVIKNMKNKSCWRVPYEVNAFNPNNLVIELFDEMLKDTFIKSKKKGGK